LRPFLEEAEINACMDGTNLKFADALKMSLDFHLSLAMVKLGVDLGSR